MILFGSISVLLVSLFLAFIVEGIKAVFFFYPVFSRNESDAKQSLGYHFALYCYAHVELFWASLQWVSIFVFGLVVFAFWQFYGVVCALWPAAPMGWGSLYVLGAVLVWLLVGYILPHCVFKRSKPMVFLRLMYPTMVLCGTFRPLALAFNQLFYFFFGDRSLRLSSNADRKVKWFSFGDFMDVFPTNESSNDEEDQENEVEIFNNALLFSQTKVRDCFIPRTEMQAIENTSDFHELQHLFVESGKSKIIVYQDDLDHVVGYIHSSEMFRLVHKENWNEHVREVLFVPETMTAQQLLHLFMQQKKSIAIVVDEFGGTTGLVTLEDLVEEIFGDIEDEHDTSSYIACETGKNQYLLSARLEVEKANELLPLDIPLSDEYQTIGGFILFHKQTFPKLNENVVIGKYQFKILKATKTKLELVQLKLTT